MTGIIASREDIVLQPPPAKALGRTSGNSWPWRRLSLRAQILSVIIAVNLLAALIAAIVVTYNAQRAAKMEIAASMRLAERFIDEALDRGSSDLAGTTFLQNLTLQARKLRHVRILVTNDSGGFAPLLPSETTEVSPDGNSPAPSWFSYLINVKDVRREKRLMMDGHQIGSVIVIGSASDEIAEVWHDSKDLAVIALALNVAVIGFLVFALGRVLRPLTGLASGLQKLELGDFRYRLQRPEVRELAGIADRFNALADRLGAAKADNGNLTRRLVCLQDDERRRIATELHDEIGPCLFGIKANVVSLERMTEDVPPGAAEKMRERLTTLAEVTDRISMLNRRLLNELRPMAIGHVSLADTVSRLVSDFERLNPQTGISVASGPIAYGYGDSVDLTVYRCLQEGITNAQRHADASTIAIELAERPLESDSGSSTALELSIHDDGHGMTPGTQWGFGLTGMDERVRAFGGTVAIKAKPGRGTCLSIRIPVEATRSGSPLLRQNASPET